MNSFAPLTQYPVFTAAALCMVGAVYFIFR